MRNAFFTFTFFGLSVLVLYGGFDHRSCQPKERIYFSLQMTKCKKKKKIQDFLRRSTFGWVVYKFIVDSNFLASFGPNFGVSIWLINY